MAYSRLGSSVVALLLAFGASSAASAVPSERKVFHPACVHRGDHARSLSIRTRSGGTLAAAILGKSKTGVILLHAVNGDACDLLPFARALVSVGYRTLVLDLPGFANPLTSESKGGGRLDPVGDVVASVKALRSAGVAAVNLLGVSFGGTVAMVAAPEIRPRPAGVVALSAAARFYNFDAEAAVARKSVPLLLVAAIQDESVTSDQVLLLQAARTTDKRVELVAGNEHATELFTGASKKRVRAVVFEFLRRHKA